MPAPILRRRILWVLLTAATVTGCSGAPPRLYVLTPIPTNDNQSRRNSRSIGVQPVTMPEYLDRSEIVTYTSTHELAVSPDNRWAERLPANVTRVVAENLSTLLGTDRVSVLPSRRIDRSDYEIAIDVDRFERTAAGDSVLHVHWAIVNGTTQKAIVSKRTRLSAHVPDDSYASLAAAMSDNLAMLSREIAAAIANLSKGNSRAGS